jgi:accessory gene regulator B
MEDLIRILASKYAKYMVLLERRIKLINENKKSNETMLAWIKRILYLLKNMNRDITFSDKKTETFRVSYYMIIATVGDLIKILIALSISFYFGMFHVCLVVIIVFYSMRMLLGGYHAETFESCFVITIGLYLLVSSIVQIIYIRCSYSVYDLIVIDLISLVLVVLYSPKFFIKETRKVKNKYKIRASIYIICLMGITFVFNKKVGLSISAGIITEVLFITPVGYLIFGTINKIINYKGVK